MAKVINDQGQEQKEDSLSLADLLDSLLQSSDGRDIGRVTDLRLREQEDGSMQVTHILCGPQAFAGRIARPLASLLRAILHDRFETEIPLTDIEEFGSTLHLRKKAEEYKTGSSERWLMRHILRWIPGSGYKNEAREQH